jgi:4-hydroxybenzoate polyprenyltransferase/phosphoserine phosphatase
MSVSPPETRVLSDVPLVVDLDGTLVQCDTLIESLLQLVKRKPLGLLRVLPQLLRGKARFKEAVAAEVTLDAVHLPYDRRLLDRLIEEQPRRRLILCTAADRRIADAVAAHLGIFDEVMATENGHNLSSSTKASALVSRFGEAGFDYAGNDQVDLPVFRAARAAWVVNATPALRRHRAAVRNMTVELPGTPRTVRAVWRSLRPHQWVKNLLVFVPLLATFDSGHLRPVWEAILAFVAFSLAASSVYAFNDLLDLPDDRAHPRKRGRPLASGAISVPAILVLGIFNLAVAITIAATMSRVFLAVLFTYFTISSLYTAILKRVILLDTLVLAGLYTIRILAGAAAIHVIPSVWLLAFSVFFFLSLALAKRHSELIELKVGDSNEAIPGREYRPQDLHVLISQGSASGYSAVLVLALYIDSATVRAQYRSPELIWLICPLLLYWINKLWLSSQRGQIQDDPVIWTLRNRVSRLVAVLSILLLVLAKWLPSITGRTTP